MRAFIGISLPQPVRVSLTLLQRQLAESQADVKWVGEEQLHVTIRFLGEIDEPQRQAVEEALTAAASRVAPFSFSLSRVGAFPSLASPRVLWVGIDQGQARLAGMAKELETRLNALEFPGESRTFVAHVTLGRVRSTRRVKELTRCATATAWRAPSPWPATSITLYQSALSSAGPRYTVLADVPLGNDGRASIVHGR